MITFQDLKKSYLKSGYQIDIIPISELKKIVSSPPRASGSTLGCIATDLNTIYIAKEIEVMGEYGKVVTLIHEMIHLFDEDLPEAAVELLTVKMCKTITEEELGYLQFLVS